MIVKKNVDRISFVSVHKDASDGNTWSWCTGSK